MAISGNRPLFSEPKVLITGVEGAGKTLFAVQQADLLAKIEGAPVYQVNIRGADPGHLPKLPFDLREMSDQKDPETGDQLPRWAVDLPVGTVVIVDECHKVYPQRGPGRPPKDIEMLAEGRQKGIRFIYLSQTPDSIDSFLRERIHRHFHLERRGNMERATIFEFDHYVFKPRTAWQERKDATVHFWAYPKEYFGWYQSAKVHQFKRRIPWKIFAALLFLPVAGFVAWQVVAKVGGLKEGAMPGKGPTGQPTAAKIEPTTEPAEYGKQFVPVVPWMPWSAPAFQGREIAAEPEVYCMASGAGVDAQGHRKGPECTCLSEQGTRYPMAYEICAAVAKDGTYNPYREPVEDAPVNDRESGRKPVEAHPGPSGVAMIPEASYTSGTNTGITGYGGIASYGGMGVGDSPR